MCKCVFVHWSIKATQTVKECTLRDCVCVSVYDLIKVHSLETGWPLIINKWLRTPVITARQTHTGRHTGTHTEVGDGEQTNERRRLTSWVRKGVNMTKETSPFACLQGNKELGSQVCACVRALRVCFQTRFKLYCSSTRGQVIVLLWL